MLTTEERFMDIRGLACQWRDRPPGCRREDAQRTEAVRRVGYLQGYAGAPRLLAGHWGQRLGQAYLAGYCLGRSERLAEPTSGRPAADAAWEER
jgi:hypothetical protein